MSISAAFLSLRIALTRANLSATPDSYLGLFCTSLNATSTTIIGLTYTVHSFSCTEYPGRLSVNHCSILSVNPLKVLPTIRYLVLASSKTPRCRLESKPRRRPCPHSAASITQSTVYDFLILKINISSNSTSF